MKARIENICRFRVGGGLSFLCLALLALGLVFAFAPGRAYADNPTFVGEVEYQQSYDEKGYPEYNADGSPKQCAWVSLFSIENASGTVVVPSTFDVVVRDDDGTETVISDVTPRFISIYQPDYETGAVFATSEEITGLDFTQCSQLQELSYSGLTQSILSLDVSGLSELEVLTIYGVPSSLALSTNECSGLESLRLCDMDVSSILSASFSQLTDLSLGDCTGADSFDGRNFPKLTSLNISFSDLTSLDLSSCAELIDLYLVWNSSLVALDAASIPQSVTHADITYNRIADTDALVERFGEEVVLPQDLEEYQTPGFPGLHVVEPDSANGHLMPGDSCWISLNGTYLPDDDEASDFYAEDDEPAFSASCFSVVSSNPEVAEALIVSEDGGQLKIQAKSPGTTTLTISYEFEGEYGTYRAEQIIDFVVAGETNPPISIAAQESELTLSAISQCALCGETHGETVSVPFEMSLQNSNGAMTTNVDLSVESSNEEIVTGSWWQDFSDTYYLDVQGVGLGSATLTIKACMWDEELEEYIELCSDTVDVIVEEAGNPQLNVRDSLRTSVWEGQTYIDYDFIITDSDDALASYEENAARRVFESTEHAGAYYYLGESELGIINATSSDESVASIETNAETDCLCIQYNAPGTAEITILDVWGNKGTCKVTVVDRVEEAKKLSLSQHELTIKKGEEFDLASLVQGVDDVDPSVPRLMLLMFTSSDGTVAPIGWNNGGVLSDGGYVSSVYGRNVGDVTIMANMRLEGAFGIGAPGSKHWYPSDALLAPFDTLTVHVVDEDSNLATEVSVSGDSHTLELGSTLTLSAAIVPADADNKDSLSWSSSDESIVVVADDGTVTPVGVGKATITATVGSVSGTFDVTVVPQVIPATNIVLSDAQTAMQVGKTQQLTVTLDPADTTDLVSWESSDEGVLTVDDSGLITAVGNGSATIIAKAGSQSAQTASIAVTTPVTGVMLDSTALELYVGTEASKLSANVQPSTASEKGVVWASDNTAIATVDADGVVKAVSPGTAVITAKTLDGGYEAACMVTVRRHVTGIALDKTAATINGAGSVALAAMLEPDDATNKNVSWRSSDTTVATVDADGIVTAVGKGSAVITAVAEDGEYSATCSIVVSNPVTSISVSPATLDLTKGQAASLTASLTGTLAGETDEAGISWESSNVDVAAVDDSGVVTAYKTGSATITAKMSDSVLATCAVSVTNPVQSVTLSKTVQSATVGDEDVQLSATVNPLDADDTAILWTSSNPKVVAVDQTGKLTYGEAGEAVVTATAGGVSAQCKVSVSAKQIAATNGSDGEGFSASVFAPDSATLQAIEAAANTDGLKLVVKAADGLTEPAQKTLDDLTAANGIIADTFDIYFANNSGKEVLVNSNGDDSLVFIVRVAMTDAMRALDPNTLTVYYVDDEGGSEKKRTWVDGEELCFETSHFSTYAVVGQPLTSSDDNVGNTAAGNTSKTKQETKSSGTPIDNAGSDADGVKAKSVEGSKLAATGDPLVFGMSAVIAVATVAALLSALLVIRKRLEERS